MGKTKINVVGQEETKKLSSEEKYKAKQAKKVTDAKAGVAKAAEQKTEPVSALVSSQEKEVSHVPSETNVSSVRQAQGKQVSKAKTQKQEKTSLGKTPLGETRDKRDKHGKRYLAARAKVDPTKSYPVSEAVQLVKETSTSKFDGSVELHLVFATQGTNSRVELPFSTGSSKKIEIASDETIKKLEAGKIDFDILIATPLTMPKLVRFAKLLGPRGLMPNPKNGTLAENPEKAVEAFSGNLLQVKSEKDAPLAHLVVAKVSQPTSEIEENIKAVLTSVEPKSITKAVVAASMGPSIRLAI